MTDAPAAGEISDQMRYGWNLSMMRKSGNRFFPRDRREAFARRSCSIGLDLKPLLHRPPDVSDATVEAYLRPPLFGLLLVPFAVPTLRTELGQH
jgi:hypothetical protein